MSTGIGVGGGEDVNAGEGIGEVEAVGVPKVAPKKGEGLRLKSSDHG